MTEYEKFMSLIDSFKNKPAYDLIHKTSGVTEVVFRMGMSGVDGYNGFETIIRFESDGTFRNMEVPW